MRSPTTDAAEKHPLDVVQLFQVGNSVRALEILSSGLVAKPVSRRRQHFADAVGADHNHQEFDAIGENRRAEGEAVGAVYRIGANRRNQDADAHADEGVGERALADRDHAEQTEQYDHEIFRRGEAQRELGQRLVSATMTTADSSPPPSAATSVQPSALAGLPLRPMV